MVNQVVRKNCLVVLLAGLFLIVGEATLLACVVKIKMGGVDITDQTQNTIVGRQISLVGEVTGGTPTTKSWSIPGNSIKNWTANLGSAYITNLSPTDLSSSSIAFYWVDGGDGKQITYTVTINGQQYHAHTTFNVKRPTSTTLTLTTSTGAIVILCISCINRLEQPYLSHFARLVGVGRGTALRVEVCGALIPHLIPQILQAQIARSTLYGL